MLCALNTSLKTIALLLPALAILSAEPPVAQADTAYISRTVNLPHRAVPVSLDIYYPVARGSAPVIHGRNLVFNGISLSAGSQPLSGALPVVFFSHGSGGNGINTGWFLKAIAEAGMIAIAPNHPGSTSRDSHPDQSLKTWERPQDISALIDRLPDILPDGLHADPDRIAAAGFSLGGYSVLALAGARISKAEFIAHCERSYGKGLNECDWFTRDGLDLQTIDRQGFERNNHDTRIRAVVSIDPGFAAAFMPQSLEDITTPVQIINLGSRGTVYAGVNGEPIAGHIPGAEYVRIEDAWHFSFLDLCRWMGPVLLAITFDDPICRDVAGRERESVHSEIAEHAVRFLRDRLAEND